MNVKRTIPIVVYFYCNNYYEAKKLGNDEMFLGKSEINKKLKSDNYYFP